MDPLLAAGLTGVFSAAVLCVYALKPRRGAVLEIRHDALLRLRQAFQERNPELAAVVMPLMHLAALHVAATGLSSERRRQIETRLAQANNPWGLLPEEFQGLCWVATIGALVATYSLTLLLGSLLPVFALAAAPAAYYSVDWQLDAWIQERRWRLSVRIPYVLDLLALTMQAGGSFIDAVEDIVAEDPDDVFVQELALLAAEIRLGTSLTEALLHLSERIGLDWFDAVVTAVIQGEKLGVPISEIVKIQADLIRQKRQERAEQLGEEAPVRMLWPTLLVMASVILVFMGPVLCRWYAGEYSMS